LSYFTNVNPDLLERIPLTARAILEIGCGGGQLGAAYKMRNPHVFYCGVEINSTFGSAACNLIDQVVIGDIEQPESLAELDQIRGSILFDALILGDVIEHLRDPWKVLAVLRGRIQPGGAVVMCVSNVAYWSIITQLLKGRWDYTDAGLLDRTHLRFFTLETAGELLRRSGWQVLDARPRHFQPELTKSALETLLPVTRSLGVTDESAQRNLSTFQWVIRATNGPSANPVNIAAFALKKVAGVNEARIDHPLMALASLGNFRVVWGECGVNIPANWSPGIFILHRQFLNTNKLRNWVNSLIQQGWIIVSEIDDDPHLWKEFVASDFYAYRAVHAITVSTAPLAEMIRSWNPYVEVFPNAIFTLPERATRSDNRVRIFFGALNRAPDLAVIGDGLITAAKKLSQKIELVIVHERALFDQLPANLSKEFHPTLPYKKYLEVLSSCDIALLPLADREINRYKSDLKFIECCAAGVIPICSRRVYGESTEHQTIGVFAEKPEEWQRAIVEMVNNSEERSRRADLGLDYVKSERMHAYQIERRAAWYQSLVARREQLEVARRQRLAKIANSSIKN